MKKTKTVWFLNRFITLLGSVFFFYVFGFLSQAENFLFIIPAILIVFSGIILLVRFILYFVEDNFSSW